VHKPLDDDHDDPIQTWQPRRGVAFYVCVVAILAMILVGSVLMLVVSLRGR
jgi:hypothetical protein